MSVSILQHADTIAAPITAPGHSAVSLVRVSGPKTKDIVRRLVSRAEQVLDSPRSQVLSDVFDLPAEQQDQEESTSRTVLDSCLVCFFAAPNSYTAEDSVEFSLHGSPYIVTRLLAALADCGVRCARAGEFTERAFLNGQMDLSQAEAVADLVNAETQSQLRVAQEQLEGRLSQAVSALGEPLRELLAEVEAYIDFPEEDIEVAQETAWLAALQAVELEIRRYLATYKTGRICREGANLVLAGLPNVGKSSLLNAMLGEDRVIVTPIPGTTRDSIEERISLCGLFVRLWDTAGLFDQDAEGASPSELEQVEALDKLGVERSWQRIKLADLVLYVFDGSESLEHQMRFWRDISKDSVDMFAIVNKADLLTPTDLDAVCLQLSEFTGQEAVPISASKGDGLPELRSRIHDRLVGKTSSPGAVLICNQRHFEELSLADQAVGRAISALNEQCPTEIFALEIRAAMDALSEIIGATSSEDILGRIFSKFCIGK